MNPSSASTIRQAPSFLTGPAGFEFDRKFGIRVFMATFLLSQKRTLESETGHSRPVILQTVAFRSAKGRSHWRAKCDNRSDGTHSRFGLGILLFETADQSQEAVEDRQRMGRTAGDEQIDRDDSGRAVTLFGVVDERSPRDGAGPDGDDELGCGGTFVGILEGEFHVLRDRA